MRQDVYNRFMAFISVLEQANIRHTIAQNQDEVVLIFVELASELWKIELQADGGVGAERYFSDGDIYGEEIFHDLLAKYWSHENPKLSLASNDTLQRWLNNNKRFGYPNGAG